MSDRAATISYLRSTDSLFFFSYIEVLKRLVYTSIEVPELFLYYDGLHLVLELNEGKLKNHYKARIKRGKKIVYLENSR